MLSPKEGKLSSPTSSSAHHHHSPCSVPSSPSASQHAVPPPSAQLRRKQASERRRICLFNTLQQKPVCPPPRVEQQHSISLEHEQVPQQSPLTVIPTRSRHAEGRARTHAHLPPPSTYSMHQQLTHASRPGADASVSEARCSPPPTLLASSARSPQGTQLNSLTQPHWGRRHSRARLVTRRAVLQELPQDAHEHRDGDLAHTARERTQNPSPSSLPLPISNSQQQIRTHGFLEAWICVRQQQPGGPAEVYEHSGPLDSATWARLQSTQQQPPKLMTVHDRSFHYCTEACGEWANFRVRLSRGFSPLEETTMFPNIVQLLGTLHPSCHFHGPSSSSNRNSSMHSPILARALSSQALPTLAQAPQAAHSITPKHHQASLDPHSRSVSAAIAAGGVVQRRCNNARSLGDVVQLLADPTETGVLAHLANTGRLLRDKPRRFCRAWGCLKARWGEEALQSLGFTPRKVHQLLKRGGIEGLVWHDELRAAHHYRGMADAAAPALSTEEGGSRSSLVSAATTVPDTSPGVSGINSSNSTTSSSSSSSSGRGDSSEAQGPRYCQSLNSAQAEAAAEAEVRALEELRAANMRATAQLRSVVPDLCHAS